MENGFSFTPSLKKDGFHLIFFPQTPIFLKMWEKGGLSIRGFAYGKRGKSGSVASGKDFP
jgi:hypothetical protein